MLSDGFFKLPTLSLAQELLGMTLLRSLPGGHQISARIVEVEAYHQDGDAAAHSFSGKSKRNQVMFGPPGMLYVYFIYGMHYCMNVVTEMEGVGAAVLIRALEPLAGLEQMQLLRGPKVKLHQLTSGPAKSCLALGIDLSHNGLDLRGPVLSLQPGKPKSSEQLVSSQRIGISKSVDLPWRFFLEPNPFVSKSPKGKICET